MNEKITLNSHSVICLNDNVLNMLVSSMEKTEGSRIPIKINCAMSKWTENLVGDQKKVQANQIVRCAGHYAGPSAPSPNILLSFVSKLRRKRSRAVPHYSLCFIAVIISCVRRSAYILFKETTAQIKAGIHPINVSCRAKQIMPAIIFPCSNKESHGRKSAIMYLIKIWHQLLL